MAERSEPRNSAALSLHRSQNTLGYQNMCKKMSISRTFWGYCTLKVVVEVNLYSGSVTETLDTMTQVLEVFHSRPFS
jgi:hypothetical protein